MRPFYIERDKWNIWKTKKIQNNLKSKPTIRWKSWNSLLRPAINKWRPKKLPYKFSYYGANFWSILLKHSIKNKPLIWEKYLHCFFTKSIRKQKKCTIHCSKNILKCHLPRFVFQIQAKVKVSCLISFIRNNSFTPNI